MKIYLKSESRTGNMIKYANYYYYAAAAATAIAGILHIVTFSNTIGRNPLTGIFFLIGGIAQLFWAVPYRNSDRNLSIYIRRDNRIHSGKTRKNRI
jgi:hypothetical protein